VIQAFMAISKSISINALSDQSALHVKSFAKVDWVFTYAAVLMHLSITVLLAQSLGR
jgi:hypothetical protein